LGLACWHRNIPFQIYERDTSFLERKQGYGLTLQQASKALKGFGFVGPRTNQTKPNSNMNTNKASTTKNASTATSGTSTTTTNDDNEDETTKILKGGITSTRHVVHTPNGDLVGEWGMRKWRHEKANTKTTKDGRNDDLDDTTGSNITQNDQTTTTTQQQPPSTTSSAKRQNIHIARQALRGQLLEALQNQVEWDHRLVSLQETETDVELTFCQSDGTHVTTRADYVVGADGIRSSVRNFLVDDTLTPLRYLGCIVILGICPLDDDVFGQESSSDLLDGHTVFQTADGTTRLYAMPFSETEYMWQLSFPVATDDDAWSISRDETQLKHAAWEKCHTWHAPIPQLLEQTPITLISGYPVYDRSLLEPHMLNKSNRITLLGDAAQ
jgi:salicylate hydroxylase